MLYSNALLLKSHMNGHNECIVIRQAQNARLVIVPEPGDKH